MVSGELALAESEAAAAPTLCLASLLPAPRMTRTLEMASGARAAVGVRAAAGGEAEAGRETGPSRA